MGLLHVLLCFFVVFASACDSSGSSKCGSGSDCCAGFTCYEKNQWWAACKQSCDPNWVDPYDNLKWSCKSLGSNSPCDDSGSKQCSSNADCCGGFQCYEKNQWWAACKQSCDPNWVDPYDNLKWSCNVKGGSSNNNNNNNNGGCGGSKAGYDVVGPDLASKQVGSEAECCNFCRSVAGCNAASIWNNICFAKSGTSVVRKDGVTAVFKGSAPADNGGNNNNNNNNNGGGDGTLFCPGPQDMNIDYGGVTFKNGGWEIRGDGRASSKTAFNILGGYMEWEMDLSQVQNGVNTNFYTSSPAGANTGSSTYCDIQRGSFESCMELDFVENNGKCATNVALHTFADDGRPGNSNCDRWGCNSLMKLNSPIVKFRAEVDNSGNIKVLVNGAPNNNYSPAPSGASNQVVVNTMKSRGAVIESSQWVGWVPGDNICPGGGSSAGSFLRVTNVRVKGSVVKGPVPAKC